MIKMILKKISINLSFLFDKEFTINKKKHFSIEKYIIKKAKNLYNKNPRLSVHKVLSYKILDLIKKRKLENFLRNTFIQEIFFIHNRPFIYFELKELKKDKKWNIWKKAN